MADWVTAISAVAAIAVAWRAERIARSAQIEQAMSEVFHEYQSASMLDALTALWDLLRNAKKGTQWDNHAVPYPVPPEIIEKVQTLYWTKKQADDISHEALTESAREDFIKGSIHFKRRIVSHFYNNLADLWDQKVLLPEVLFRRHAEADMRIIPQILVPIENKLRTMHEPPSTPIDESHLMMRLYLEARRRSSRTGDD